MNRASIVEDDVSTMDETPSEYSSDPTPRRRTHRATVAEIGRIRAGFFVAACLWGFLSGAAGFAAARGTPDGGGAAFSWGAFAASGLIAIAGSLVFARAYDEFKRRRA